MELTSTEYTPSTNSAYPTRAVVLVVDKYSQDVHLASLTAGVKYPIKYGSRSGIEYTRGFYSILADLANVQQGVSVFFYRRRIDEPTEGRGFIGEWAAAGDAYEDLSSSIVYNNLKILGICSNCGCPVSTLEDEKIVCKYCKGELNGHILPLRFPLRTVYRYPRYLDDNTAYVDITDEGRLSTLIFRKVYGAGRERSVNPILPEEAEKLRRLLHRVEQDRQNHQVSHPSSMPYNQSVSIQKLSDYINLKQKYKISGKGSTHLYETKSGELVYETILEFWLMLELGRNPQGLLATLGIPPHERLEWFANQVLFGIGGEKSDVLLLMRNGSNQRCRAIVIELKKGVVGLQSIQQVRSYAYWIAQLATAQVQHCIQMPFKITPIMIGHRVSRGAKPFAPFSLVIPYSTPLTVEIESPQVFTYSVDTSNNTLQLARKI